MKLKLVHKYPQTHSNLESFERAVESELRKRTQLAMLFGNGGIISSSDVTGSDAPCALVVNESNTSLIDVLAGTLVFPNGEILDVAADSIVGVQLPNVDRQYVLRIQYEEEEVGARVSSPFAQIAGLPMLAPKAASAMLHVEEMAEYSALPLLTRQESIVLGLATLSGGVLTLDNGRDTMSSARPWASTVDAQHRSKVGTGLQTDTNVHGVSAADLSVGDLTLWQALAGDRPVVMSTPRAIPKVPGEICQETIPAGNLLVDSTGRLTGLAGAFYAIAGKWPERLVFAALESDRVTEVAAWHVPGTQIIAFHDPHRMSSAQSVFVRYSHAFAGSLPDVVNGATQLTMQQPASGELIAAGSVLRSKIVDPTVYFTDAGLLPQEFNVMMDSAGVVYKTPSVLLCGTTLDSLSGSPIAMTAQPRVPSRIRVGLFNHNPGMTGVTIQITGKDADGASITEDLIWTGALAASVLSATPVTLPFRTTSAFFSEVTSVQATSRINDGPNASIAVFAMETPAGQQGTVQDALLARVHWNGAVITAPSADNPKTPQDLRRINGGGDARRHVVSGIATTFGASATSFLASPPTRVFVAVELFDDPFYQKYDDSAVRYPQLEGLDGNQYRSRLFPLGSTPFSPTACFFGVFPQSTRPQPITGTYTVRLNFKMTNGTTVTAVGVIEVENAYNVRWTSTPTFSSTVYAMSVEIDADSSSLNALSQLGGFVLRSTQTPSSTAGGPLVIP